MSALCRLYIGENLTGKDEETEHDYNSAGVQKQPTSITYS
uniref:Uncharacterized protein n=1 Tax=Anguilla anguilla TaxID=7936 RepID=A0A0E9QML4_ANGAN